MRAAILSLLALLLVAGCTRTWKTDYADVIDPAVSQTWRVTSVNVVVPDSLTVTEDESYTPEADIVWREEPLIGGVTRQEQVIAIMTEAAERGSAGLRGSTPVQLNIRMVQFHALTERARTQLQNSGVHNIIFDAQVVDRTGRSLSPVDRIYAELPAYSGRESRAAVSRGETQRVRIVSHVSSVIAGWLGAGPDVKFTFVRRGR